MVVALLSSLLITPGQTAMDILGGSPIQATPFDRRLDAAGAFGSFTPFLGSLRSNDDLFLRARSIRYEPDPAGQDYWQTPEETDARWAGDCEDKAIWLFAQLKMNGYSNVRLVVGRYRSIDRSYHVWVTMADPQDDVLILDPTAQKRMWRAGEFGEGFYKPLYSFDGINRYRHDS